ncbi:MAG TPA: alkaline phosphatase family protein [Candidatus Nitrosotalea sp.]|nr:alkaline phosphatase family protein [Candidatus Nitrosotalea sp.]
MNRPARLSVLAFLFAAIAAQAQIERFQHVVVVVQENRTPDNLFQGLCSPPFGSSNSCSANPNRFQYDIQTSDWLDNTSPTGTTQPGPVALAAKYDLDHSHKAFTQMCDLNFEGACQMDAAAKVKCAGTCPAHPQFKYADNSTGTLNPYLQLATQYGWANYMFQTNQGPSFPAHQFIFGGTSAPSSADDASAIFASENVSGTTAGCIATAGTTVLVIGPSSGENQKIYPCFEHETLSDLLQGFHTSWKYYTPGAGSIWTAPDAIQHICEPNKPTGGSCVGSEWVSNVVIGETKVLDDISKCNLAGVTWIIPSGQNSDHARSNDGGGPDWVASIVNAIGNQATCVDGETYWHDTAILITWDDWGGWYDHEPPQFLTGIQGDYQYGFRVPLIVVSAYTPQGYIDGQRYDFGSVLRFIERNFGIAEGSLNFADARTRTDLTSFFNFFAPPRTFHTISTTRVASDFLNDKTPPTDPDDD